MVRGVEILDVPELRAAEEEARDDEAERPGNGNRPGDGDRPGNGNPPGEDERPGKGNNPGQGNGQGPGGASGPAQWPASTAGTGSAVDLPVDRSAELLPDELPPRPTIDRNAQGGEFCALPGRPVA
jgi:hypothetical protein